MKANLSIELATISGRIYCKNPERYKRLIVWIKKYESEGWNQATLAKCLQMAEPYLDNAPSWWAYLCSIMSKASAKVAEEQNNGHKKQDVTQAWKNILDPFVKWVEEQRSNPK